MTRAELGQALNLETDWIPAGRRNRSGKPLQTEYITIHNTGNADPGTDARMHGGFLRKTGYWVTKAGKRRYVSWHYTVDDARVVRHLPLSERGMHAGSSKGNERSIAIEICMHKGIDQKAAFARAARLAAALRYDLGIPAENVVPHYRWSGKECPVLLLNGGKPGAKWQAFVDQVREELDSIE